MSDLEGGAIDIHMSLSLAWCRSCFSSSGAGVGAVGVGVVVAAMQTEEGRTVVDGQIDSFSVPI